MVLQKGTLVLNPASLQQFKTKDRQAALVLEEVGLKEIQWFINEETIKHYICPVDNCNELFIDFQVLKNHFFKTHNERPFKCNFNNCKWSFATKSKLERHKNSHLNLKWFKCIKESCGKMFTTLYNLRQHLKTVHEKADQFVCLVKDCNAAFHNQRSLDLHKVTHENLSRTYICDKEGCDKSFVTKNALCSHMRSHEHKLEDLKCSWEGCTKVFELPCRLREHMRIHTGEKPFRCDYPGCGWSFYSGSKLHRHRNKHLQIRKFICCVSHCKKSFLRSQHLKEHILTHSKTNTKNFSCPVEHCDSKFGSKNLVYRHVKKVHRLESLKRMSESDDLDGDFGMKISKAQDHSQLLGHQCISQLDTLNLLSGDYDVAENVSTQLPELMSSELLVAMTSIESGNAGDFLTDIAAVDSSCNNQSLVVMTPIEANNNEALVINDSNVQYVLDSPSPPSKIQNKKKTGSGSARTSYTYKDVLREKTFKAELEDSRKVQWLKFPEPNSEEPKSKKWKRQLDDLSNTKFSMSSDVALGSGLSDHNSLIIKDELYSQEDLPVLLLDQAKLRNPIFEPSTINLRDLE